MTWLQTQLKKLESTQSKYKDEIAKISAIDSDIFNDFCDWTPLKLAFLHYVMAIYTAIISKYFEHIFYVDLFAGSGINKMRKGKNCLIGSPFIAVLNHRDKYDKFFFCDNNDKFIDSLTKRLDVVNVKNVKLCCDDCNKELDNILDEIKKVKNKHSLFFIDPFALEFTWESMKKVLEIRSDIIFTFMTIQIERAWKSALAQPDYETNKLNAFFGDDSWKKATKVSNLLRIYKENISKARENAVIESVEIKGEGFHYDVLFITNRTKGENPWLKGITQAKKEIEQNSAAAVKVSLQVITGKQAGLSSFCN